MTRITRYWTLCRSIGRGSGPFPLAPPVAPTKQDLQTLALDDPSKLFAVMSVGERVYTTTAADPSCFSAEPRLWRQAPLNWPCFEKWPVLKFWGLTHGHRVVPVEVYDEKEQEEAAQMKFREQFLSLRDFCLQWDREEKVLYLAQHPLLEQIPELKNDLKTTCLGEEGTCLSEKTPYTAPRHAPPPWSPGGGCVSGGGVGEEDDAFPQEQHFQKLPHFLVQEEVWALDENYGTTPPTQHHDASDGSLPGRELKNSSCRGETRPLRRRAAAVESFSANDFHDDATSSSEEEEDATSAPVRARGGLVGPLAAGEAQAAQEMASIVSLHQELPALHKPFLIQNLWLGTGDTVTELHYDSYPNAFVQIAGIKRVKLIKPSWGGAAGEKGAPQIRGENGGERRRPGLGESAAAARDAQYEQATRNMRVKKPSALGQGNFTNLKVFGRDADVSATYDFIVYPGDVVYIPRFYWHAMWALGPSISLSLWAQVS